MTKRIGTEQPASMGGGMSREDRKNEAISRMFEKQEQLRKKREEKKKLAINGPSKNEQSRQKPSNGSSGQRKQKLLQPLPVPERKPESSSVQIHVVFSDNARASSSSNRYFFERKQTVEERQRQEQQEMWTRLAQAQFMNQQSRHGQQADQGQGQGMSYYINTGGDTGGNYEVNEDYSASSYLSSSSKRQRAEEWGPRTQYNQQLYMQQQSMMLPRSNYSNVWDQPSPQMLGQNDLALQQAALAQAFNYNQQCFDEQSPVQSQQMPFPTPSTPFVNPISADESSAPIDKKSERSEKKVEIKVDIKPPNDIQKQSTGITLRQNSDGNDGNEAPEVNEAQSILELTKSLQNQLQRKRMAAPPADTAPEVDPSQKTKQPPQS